MWIRLGPSNKFRSDSIADPMTLGYYKDSKMVIITIE